MRKRALPIFTRMQTARKRMSYILATLVLFVLPQTAKADIKAVASIKPLHSLVASIMQGAGSPTLLLKGGSPHSYALKPSNARALQAADLIVWVGPSLERFLTGPLKSLAPKARLVTLEKLAGLTRFPLRTKHSPLKAEPLHRHALLKNHNNDDPHLWLSIDNAQKIVEAIKRALMAIDPANAALYQKNATAITARLASLKKELKTELAPLKDKSFVTFHDSFQYFEKQFDLNHVGALTLDPQRQPGARHLMKLRKRIKTLGVGCVFTEPQFRPKLIDLLVEGTKAKTGILDPLGVAIKKGPELYFSLLRNNARAFISCLGGR